MKKLFLLLTVLLTTVISYGQTHYISFKYDEKKSVIGGKLGVTETAHGFIKVSLTEDYFIHYHDYTENICKTYYVYDESEIIKYDSVLTYSTAWASTDKVNPDNGAKIKVVLWQDSTNNKVAFHVIRDDKAFMYYIYEGEVSKDGDTNTAPFTRW